MQPIRRLLLGVGLIVIALLASAVPSAGSVSEEQHSTLPVAVNVDVLSRFVEQTIILTGWIGVTTSQPRIEKGVSVFDLQIDTVHLQGASQLGVITANERPDDGGRYVSHGEVRALQPAQQFPASSYIDLYADIVAPHSSFGPLAFHNEAALHLIPWQGDGEVPLTAWPPLGTSYRLEPLLGVDNDGDGLVDEDTADEDHDVYVDEDRPGPDPLTPGLTPCGDDADCDGRDGEDPPAPLCGSLCDDDGDGATDEDPSCVPLLNEANTSLPLGVCVADLNVQLAPGTPSFSVRRAGPSREHPADILGLVPDARALGAQAPFVRIPCASLGLTPDGCDDGSDGDQDDIDGLSYGSDFQGGTGPSVAFSVSPGALGLPGSAVEAQDNCPPASPGLAPEAESDVFASSLDGTNDLLFDGNGPIGSCTVAFPLGLIEAATTRDDVDALDMHDASAVDANGDGVPEAPVYFSLSAGSPTLTALGFSAGDILVTQNGGAPTVFATATQLGLGPKDDLDAFCLNENGNRKYDARDVVYYSIAPRQTGLTSNDVGPGDILAPGTTPRIVRRATALGLAAADDIDALECRMQLASAKANGDVTCDGITDAVDALFVLQFDARLLPTLPCPQNGDVSGDAQTNSLDAALILQIAAGLFGLPS